MRIAFFDLDKTIIKKDSIIPFMIFYLKKNPKSIIYYIRLIPYLILFFLKIIDNNKIKYEIASIFRNITIEFGEKIGKEFADSKNKKYTLIMVTASFELYAKFIAKNLGFNKCMGTELWTFRGKFTGYMYGKNCYGAAKRYRLFTEHIFPNHKYKNIAYSDSISDLPLLNFAETKICVNPNNKFRKYILNNKEGFLIVKWR